MSLTDDEDYGVVGFERQISERKAKRIIAQSRQLPTPDWVAIEPLIKPEPDHTIELV